MTEPAPAPPPSAPAAPGPAPGFAGRRGTPLLPESSLAGRALIIVIVIMAFLASITAGSVQLIAEASAGWSSAVSREMTVQIRPRPGRDIELDIQRAADIIRRTAGIADVRIYSRAESDKLLEPWLGAGLSLGDLPVPRLIVLKLAPDGTADTARLKADLGAVPGASLDDHRVWISRLSLMARALVLIGLVIMALVLTTMALAVAFATRGAMAGNREIIDVLHLVGAEDRFIAREFQRHFLALGLRGGAIGGMLAVLCFLAAGYFSGRWLATPGGDQVEALFGAFALGWPGYASVAVIVLVVAAITAVVSRATVFRNLRGLD
jgi:cell division transport system permease protein